MRTERTPGTADQPPDLSSLCTTIAGHAPFPIAAVEGARHIVRYVNPAFCRLMDKPGEQLVGKPFCEMLPEKDECVTLLDRVLRTGKPESFTEQEHSKPHPVSWSYTMWPLIVDEHPVGVMVQVTETAQLHEMTLAMNEALLLGSVRQHELTATANAANDQLQEEITERKQAEDALRASDERFRSLFASAPMAVFACDRDAVIQQYNRRAAELWGREPECGVERLCDSVEQCLPGGTSLPHTSSSLMDVLRTGYPVHNLEVFIARPDGSRLPVLASFAALKNAQGEVTGAISSFTDITGRMAAEAALRESERRSRQLFEAAEGSRVIADAARLRSETAGRAKDDFLAALSHELRTPLNPALLLATALIDDPSLPPHVREDIGVIAKGITLQVQLVDDLLDLTTITGGKLRLDLQSIDTHDALREALERVRSEIQERRIGVTLDLSAAHQCIHADAVRMQQVFWNLLKNAVKFTPHGGTITVRTIESTHPQGMLLVEIIDSGIGIAPEMLEKIFDSFTQEHHDPSLLFGGLGLGLAITRRLVELQHGHIHALSHGRGCGATFRVEMPLSLPVANAAGPAAPEVGSVPDRPGRRILLVEDHEVARLTLARLLERRGHTVFVAATVAGARKLATDSRCDLVISDLGLPDGDGHTLMAEFRDEHGLPGIALSGYGAEADLRRSRESGFFIHLTKPVHIRTLEGAIDAAPPAAGKAPD